MSLTCAIPACFPDEVEDPRLSLFLEWEGDGKELDSLNIRFTSIPPEETGE